MTSQAIVLKQISDTRFLILDSKCGMQYIAYYTKWPNTLFRSALIAYSSTQTRTHMTIDTVHIQSQPASWARTDIQFLHHVIDTLIATLCFDQPEPHIFKLLTYLYQSIHAPQQRARLIFMARLCFLLGIQPENVLHLESLMHHVARYSFSQLLHNCPYTSDNVYKWVSRCLQTCSEYKSLHDERVLWGEKS